MPSGVQLRDARRQLFEAAERVLVRSGPSALTSRAVTDEAGCAKGVLHRHFADFDAFLVDLVLDRADQLDTVIAQMEAESQRRPVVANVTIVLAALLDPVPAAIISLITFRDEVRNRLRSVTPGGGIGILGRGTTAISSYLDSECDRGRICADADVPALTLALVGGAHLLATESGSVPPGQPEITAFAGSVLGNAVLV